MYNIKRNFIVDPFDDLISDHIAISTYISSSLSYKTCKVRQLYKANWQEYQIQIKHKVALLDKPQSTVDIDNTLNNLNQIIHKEFDSAVPTIRKKVANIGSSKALIKEKKWLRRPRNFETVIEFN